MVSTAIDVASEEGLLSFFSHLLEECHARGFHEPYYVTILGSNGYLAVYQHDSRKPIPTEQWAEHAVDGGVQLPAALHAIDPATGKAILVRINHDGTVAAELTN